MRCPTGYLGADNVPVRSIPWVIGVEEKLLDVEDEISSDFLDWARSCGDLEDASEVDIVAADPGFIEFVHDMSKREEEEAGD